MNVHHAPSNFTRVTRNHFTQRENTKNAIPITIRKKEYLVRYPEREVEE